MTPTEKQIAHKRAQDKSRRKVNRVTPTDKGFTEADIHKLVKLGPVTRRKA